MSFLFKSTDAHTSEIDDTLQYFNAAAGSLDNNVSVASSSPSVPILRNKRKKKKTNRFGPIHKLNVLAFRAKLRL